MIASEVKTANQRKECPLCGASVDQANLLAETTYMCSGCSLVYNRMLPKIDAAAKWEDYTAHDCTMRYDLGRNDFFQDFWNYVQRITGKTAGSMLDVGCGRGLMLKIAKHSGWQAQGIETSPGLCGIASKYSECKVLCGSVESMILPVGAYYDIVLMVDVFRCLPNPYSALENCASACRSNGAIVIRELNILHEHSFDRFRRSDEYDLQCLSPRTAREFLRKVGVTDVVIVPSPMSLMTIPAITHFHPVIRRLLMKSFNSSVQTLFALSLKRWLSIVPEMLIVGFVDKRNGEN